MTLNECEVCGRRHDSEDYRHSMAVTWVINEDGREEGTSHCYGCNPLLLQHVVSYANGLRRRVQD